MSLFQVTKKQDIEGYELRTMTGDIVSFTPSYSQLLQDPFSDLNVTVNVLATGGNGTPDNPNPINGYTAVNLTVCGVNLLPKCNAESYTVNSVTVTCNSDGTFTSTGTASGGSYLKDFELSAPVTIVSGMWLHCLNDFCSATLVLGFRYTDGTGTDFTLSTNDRIIDLSSYVGKKVNKIRIYGANGTVMNGTIKPMFLTVNTASDYAPYNGQTYTVAFGQTVYGGILDVTRGKLHVTWSNVDLGDLEYITQTFGTNSGFMSMGVPNAVPITGSAGIANAKCSVLKLVSNGDMARSDNNMFALGAYWQSGANLYIVATDYATPEAFKTAMSGQKLIYELATPFDIDLTPEVISAIVGENNVFADCGNSTVTCLI